MILYYINTGWSTKTKHFINRTIYINHDKHPQNMKKNKFIYEYLYIDENGDDELDI